MRFTALFLLSVFCLSVPSYSFDYASPQDPKKGVEAAMLGNVSYNILYSPDAFPGKVPATDLRRSLGDRDQVNIQVQALQRKQLFNGIQMTLQLYACPPVVTFRHNNSNVNTSNGDALFSANQDGSRGIRRSAGIEGIINPLGYKVAEVAVGDFKAGDYISNVNRTIPLRLPPAGSYSMVLVAGYWAVDSNQGRWYQVVDWKVFPNPVTIGRSPWGVPSNDSVSPGIVEHTTTGISIHPRWYSTLSTKASKITLRGNVYDNVSPQTLQYTIRSPRDKVDSSWRNIPLASNSTSKKSWSLPLNLNILGSWTLQFRVLDAGGNVSDTSTLRINRQ
jgi:hypothetical protein